MLNVWFVAIGAFMLGFGCAALLSIFATRRLRAAVYGGYRRVPFSSVVPVERWELPLGEGKIGKRTCGIRTPGEVCTRYCTHSGQHVVSVPPLVGGYES